MSEEGVLEEAEFYNITGKETIKELQRNIVLKYFSDKTTTYFGLGPNPKMVDTVTKVGFMHRCTSK